MVVRSVLDALFPGGASALVNPPWQTTANVKRKFLAVVSKGLKTKLVLLREGLLRFSAFFHVLVHGGAAGKTKAAGGCGSAGGCCSVGLRYKGRNPEFRVFKRHIVSLEVSHCLGQERSRMQKAALSVNVSGTYLVGFFREKLKDFLLLVQVILDTAGSESETLIRSSLLDDDSIVGVHAVRAKSETHHELSLRHSSGILGMGRTSIHLFHRAKPGVGIQRLANRGAVETQLFTPLPLHVELDLSAFLLALNGLKKQVFEFGKLSNLVVVQDTRSQTLKGSGTQLGVLHLLGKTRLLTLEHVAQEFVEFQTRRNRKLTGFKLGD
mmetsp:Transcript_6576/g.16017  ORF Transcript_6576/g.16017 Transcript_6576/m.16017 type:complete len:324 (+) Transcript_6576:1026-1997(+)